MEFTQRGPVGTSTASSAQDKPVSGVADILAAYGVEPAKEGARPEVEDEEPEDRRPRGSSGEGGTRMRRWGGAHDDRQRLISKYPALQHGGPN